MAFRILGGLLGAFFFLQGLGWILDAQGAAEGLGMPLLDGIARSTQVGDLTGFFLCLGGFGLWGAYQQSPTWLLASGFLLFGAAVGRTLAAVVWPWLQARWNAVCPRCERASRAPAALV